MKSHSALSKNGRTHRGGSARSVGRLAASIISGREGNLGSGAAAAVFGTIPIVTAERNSSELVGINQDLFRFTCSSQDHKVPVSSFTQHIAALILL